MLAFAGLFRSRARGSLTGQVLLSMQSDHGPTPDPCALPKCHVIHECRPIPVGLALPPLIVGSQAKIA